MMSSSSRCSSPSHTPRHGALGGLLPETQPLRPLCLLSAAHPHAQQPAQPLPGTLPSLLRGQPPWLPQLRQLAARRGAAVLYALLGIALLAFVAAGGARHRQHTAAGAAAAADGQPPVGSAASSHMQRTVVAAAQARGASGGELPAAWSGSGSANSSSSSSSSSCAYGALPGTWVSSAPPGARWQVLDPDCQLTNWLAAYAAVSGASSSGSSSSGSSSSGSSSSGSSSSGSSAEGGSLLAPAVGSADLAGSEAGDRDGGDGGGSAAAQLPTLRVLLLSDSVDRYVLQHVCDYLGGVKRTMRTPQQAAAAAQDEHGTAVAASAAADAAPAVGAPDQGAAASSAAAAAAAEAAAGAAPAGPAGGAPPDAAGVLPGALQPLQPLPHPAPLPAAPAGPSSLNATAYAFHTCVFGRAFPLRLASSYFPGVHPTGPFHRGLTQNYAARLAATAGMWDAFAGPGQPPHVVGVASALWDVARLWAAERDELQGAELSRALLDAWVANYSRVVGAARATFPQTQLWLSHTTMLPRHDPDSGLMAKPYLGKRYFIEQLNAAAATASRRLGMGLVDYAAISRRFADGQAYLADLIHPNAAVALEAFNALLNLALAQRGR